MTVYRETGNLKLHIGISSWGGNFPGKEKKETLGSDRNTLIFLLKIRESKGRLYALTFLVRNTLSWMESIRHLQNVLDQPIL